MVVKYILYCFLFFITITSGIKTILSFGGNGNVGSEALNRLITSEELLEIYVVFRSGIWHFDNDPRIAKNVITIKCDRSVDPPCVSRNYSSEPCDINSLKLCPEFMKLVKDTGGNFDAVLDFTAFESKWVRDSLELLNKVGLYVYISSDSVYEVCEFKGEGSLNKESDAVRPDDINVRKKFQMNDPFGHAKLAGEEALKEQSKIPWISLRLSDVIGPRDTTKRLWLYVLWIQFYELIGKPINLPHKIKGLKSSITYVRDVGSVILSLIFERRAIIDATALNRSYNLAMDDEFTLKDIVRYVSYYLNTTTNIEFQTNDWNFHLYPTVTRGGVDTSDIKRLLGFRPTKPEWAFGNATKWCQDTFLSSVYERTDMISKILTYVVQDRNKAEALMDAIDDYLEKNGVITERLKKSQRGEIGKIEL